MAVELLKDFDGKNAAELRDLADVKHVRSYYHPNFPYRASVELLCSLRSGVEELAAKNGFPDRAKQGGAADFDREVATFLFSEMSILPADAAVEEVWNFFTLVLLPHIALWRYPNTGQNFEYPRLIGKRRNVFRKLWWRAFVLGPALSEKLGEDETVGIMERPSIGGNRSLARAIVIAHVRVQLQNPGKYPASEFLREVNKRIRAINSVRGLTFLSETELQREIDEVFEGVREAWESGELISRSAKAKHSL
ncbi:hypothetical protein [Dietzia cercidiphylli]|uniref:hypothetical protein n=1 Tax=Dietzia cercidiphylli TaxID=498199 RepID=UPI00223B9090|nr:hypothetical protein [Dietzia cercidiphylli]MCT1515624.1 hypothetical protein [Dietzia cercidiphylli]